MSRQSDDRDEERHECPLCGAAMIRRGCDPLVRFLGLALLYGAALLLLVWLPELGLEEALAVGAFGACGWILVKDARWRWCPGCWYAEKQPPVDRA